LTFLESFILLNRELWEVILLVGMRLKVGPKGQMSSPRFSAKLMA